MNNTPIGCDALADTSVLFRRIISRDIWHDSPLPYAAILSRAHVAKMLDPFQHFNAPASAIFPDRSGKCIRCFSRSNLDKTSLVRAASGDLKKAPNLGDNVKRKIKCK
jgi:hypothetical protein